MLLVGIFLFRREIDVETANNIESVRPNASKRWMCWLFFVCTKERMKKVSKTWKIPVTWEMYGTVEVVADTLEEAYDFVRKDTQDIPLPDYRYYVDGSFRPSYERSQLEEIRDLYNFSEK